MRQSAPARADAAVFDDPADPVMKRMWPGGTRSGRPRGTWMRAIEDDRGARLDVSRSWAQASTATLASGFVAEPSITNPSAENREP
jgi:hypothetical protein